MNYVLYHANCPDGFCSAMIAHTRLRDHAKYIPVKYHEPPPEMLDASNLYILDFSYPVDILNELEAPITGKVILLDHHKTAEEDLRNFVPEDNTLIVFDMKECGASLTWEYFYPHIRVPLLVKYIRDRDLWLWELPDSREISAALRSYPTTFETWEPFLHDSNLLELRREGQAILRSQEKQILALCNSAIITRIGQYLVPAVNTPIYGSEIANLLAERYGLDHSFAVCYSQQKDSRWRYELRSIGDFDVSKVAREYGSGGHKNAAGFIIDRCLF